MEYPVLDVKATGARIRELRIARRLKVEEVARFMGFESEQAVYKWQRGDSLPTIDNLYALSRLFETSVDDILRGNREEDERSSSFFTRMPSPVWVFAHALHDLNHRYMFWEFDLCDNRFNKGDCRKRRGSQYELDTKC